MISLAVKYRPQTLEDIVGQDSIVKVLNRQLVNNEFKNAYLFAGCSGCGKTTAARAFARRINNNIGAPIEIDGASNNGVDNVKTIIANAQERSLEGKYKIYIIDECHSLTSQAWQAFLKCIEEPPTYTIFIFCTTDPQKIPATILNRVQRFNFAKISAELIESRLNFIAEAEGFTEYRESTNYISKVCNGSMREAISLLDKCASYSKDVNINNVLYILGKASYDMLFQLINSLIDCDEKKTLEAFENIRTNNTDMKLFVDDFIVFCLDVSKYILFKSMDITSIPKTKEQEVNMCINFDNASSWYGYVTDKLLKLKNMLKTDVNPVSTTQVVLLQIARCQ